LKYFRSAKVPESSSNADELRLPKYGNSSSNSKPDKIETTVPRTDVDLEKGGVFSRFNKNAHEREAEEDGLGKSKRRERRWFWIDKNLKYEPFTVRNQLKGTLFCSWINILLFAIPVGFVLSYIHANRGAVFFVNFVAVVPMATILGIAMDELRLRTGDVLGAMIYISLGALRTSCFMAWY